MQHKSGQGRENYAPVEHTVFQHLPLGPKPCGDGPQEDKAQSPQDNAQHDGDVHEKGEETPGPGIVPLAHGPGHKGAAPRAEHEAHGTQYHQYRHDKVDSGKGGLAHEVRHEKAVHHAVY